MHIDYLQLWKTPQKGVFLSPRKPQGTWTRVLPGSAIYILHREPLHPCFDKVSEKYNGWIKSYELKSVIFWPIWGILGCFWPFLTPLGAQWELFLKIRECFFLPLIMLKLHAKFQKKTMVARWEKLTRTDGRTHGRTDGRNRVNSKVPIPTKVRGPINSEQAAQV